MRDLILWRRFDILVISTGSSRTLHVLTEFSEENSSLELGGEFGPGMEGWARSDQDFAEQKTKR